MATISSLERGLERAKAKNTHREWIPYVSAPTEAELIELLAALPPNVVVGKAYIGFSPDDWDERTDADNT